MLRHFKMELKRQQMLLSGQEAAADENNQTAPASLPVAEGPPLVGGKVGQHKLAGGVGQQQRSAAQTDGLAKVAPVGQPKRVRGRRSSKPQMEKRRRARINECLDILKSYVLTDSDNLSHLGIDTTGSENQDEETIARRILKSSGLINRHRGRKNPNKLEKADILELTVNYVRRLHEQREDLLRSQSDRLQRQLHQQQQQQQMIVPAHLSQQLTLDLSPKSRLINQQHPITPPPSSASSSPNNPSEHMSRQTQNMSQLILSKVLDNYSVYEWHQ